VLARNPQRAATALLWSLLAVEASAGASSKVVNDEFKFSVSVPAAMVSCVAASGTHPHGFAILPRPGKQDCRASTPRPYVGLYGDYNVLFAQAPAQALNLLCPRSQGTAPRELENLAFPGHASAVCRSDEFEFSVGVPAAMVSCVAASGTHPHGVAILLRPGKQSCRASAPRPFVGLYGDYNVLFDQAPAQALNLLCPRSQGTAPRELENLAFPGHASAVCRSNDRNGWVFVFVVTQAGSWPDKEPPSVPYINYTADLHTTPVRLAGDLETFKKILATVNISAK
jgi:hypothetical protein